MSESVTLDASGLVALVAMLDGDRALTVEASALLLGMKVGTFRQESARPGFPIPARMGKRLTYRRGELLAWWEAERERQKRNKAA